MRLKKIISGILVCALVVTSVLTADVAAVKAAEVTIPVPVKTYDFNDSLDDGKAVLGNNQNLADYTGAVTYEAGRKDGDKAVKLGEYGIKLSPANIGSEWTVNAWMMPTAALANNQAVLFVGYHSPEKWVGFAGAGGNTLKAWTNGSGLNGASYGWATVASPTYATNEWVMLTLSYANGTVSVYKNGTLVDSGGAADAFNGANQSIYLGVTNWDTPFAGLADDVSVYANALTARQVRFLYDNKTDEDILNEEGISATESLNMYATESKKINVAVPSILADSDGIEISYASANSAIATVSEDGRVSGVAAGTTTITAKAKLGSVEKTAATTVKVSAPPAGFQKDIAAEYDLSKSSGGKLSDLSGRGNDAAIKGTDITFSAPDGEDEDSTGIMTITGDSSYIELPMGIMDALVDQEAFTIETRFAKSSACGNNAWLFCLGSNVKGTGTNYMFLSPNFESKTLRAGIKDSSTEKLFGTSIQPVVDNWYTVDMVFDHGIVKLYWNGVLIQGDAGDRLESGFSIMNDVVNPGTSNNILGYIGKSCWSADKNYQGKISSFKIYNTALTDEEIQLSRDEYKEALEETLDESLDLKDILGNNPSEDEVRYNLTLPSAIGEVPLTWSAIPDGVISNRGIVTNPTDADKIVTMTAQLKSGALVATKEFELTVKKLDDSALQELLTKAKKMLEESENLDEAMKAMLKKSGLESAVAKAEESIAASSQYKVNNAQRNLSSAIYNFYPSVWVDPFTAIDDSMAGETVEMLPGTESEEAFVVIPDEIKDMVTVKYESSDPDTAEVDAKGNVTAKKSGYSKITATVVSNYDAFTMEYQTLVKVDLDMSKISAKAKNERIEKGQTTEISVEIPEDLEAFDPEISYQADDFIVSVTESEGNATVTALRGGKGTVTVTVRAGGKIKAIPVTVQVALQAEDLNGITASAAKTSIVQGETTKINVTYPAEIQTVGPTVAYAATGAVTVAKDGTVTGVSAGTGTVTVTITADGIERQIQIPITVTAKQESSGGDTDTKVDLSKIVIKAKATKIAKGKTTTISIAYPNTATKSAAKVMYKASGAVSVKAGKVTGKKAGKGIVTVTIKASGQNAITKKITINVGNINGKSSVKVKKSITLKVKGLSGKVKWSVNKKKLASITSKGKLKAKKAGKVKVTAKVGTVTMTKTITIKK